jgi:hypothetical protein
MRCRTGIFGSSALRRSRIGDAPLARRILSGKRLAFPRLIVTASGSTTGAV